MVDSQRRNIPVKLFQNLSIDIAEVVKSLFLFIALAAILFNVAESFEQFWLKVTKETFLYNYFKIHLLVQENKLFFLALVAILFGLSNFGRGSPKEPSCKIISKSMHWLRRRSRLKVFLFLALEAILFNGAERFEQFRQSPKKHSCEIISKSVNRYIRRSP